MAKKKWVKAEKESETAESNDSAARKDDKPSKDISHKKVMKKMYRGEK